MEKTRLFMIAAMAVLILLVWGGVWVNRGIDSQSDLETKGQPTVGNAKAPVHLVVFEELKCPQCRRFNLTVADSLRKDYVETNKIQYTVIPVSFIENSMPAAAALLCVYHQDGDKPNSGLFFTFLSYIFHHQPTESLNWATPDNLLDMAKNASPEINLDHLKRCIDSGDYSDQIGKNTLYAAKLGDGSISTPGVYINGRKQNDITLDGLKNALNEALRHSGSSWLSSDQNENAGNNR